MNQSANYSDEELISGALNNDRTMQEQLYRKYADAMFTVACNYSDNDDEAADILQEGFIKVFRNLAQHDTTKSLGGWIRRIIINTALESFKQKRRYFEVVEDYNFTKDQTNNDIFDELEAADVIKLVNTLPSKAQMVLKLYSIEGFAHHEIAEALSISIGTSKSQLSRAKELLRGMIKQANG